MISIECRYSNPLAASASFRGVLVFDHVGTEIGRTYEAKAVDLRVL
jgi:hypothetical protein